ncbi:calcium-activated chloride channel regulator family member 3-like [Lissotriton helveticus]
MSFSPWIVAFLLAIHVFCMATCSMVELKNNGYENLVIAINPALPEDRKIIDNIKNMMTEASAYLFTATQRRAYFKNIKILIPLTWSHNSSYSRAKTELFDKADAIVADPFLKYGDDPYTLEYGGCGEPGKYIHFTPNFRTDDSLLAVYGPRGRVFVHEWAHLRWGVFDEYNKDKPFYISGDVNVQATRCSTNIQGVYKYIECKGKSCSSRDCRPDALTGLLEDGCTFIPDTVQNAKTSIMYMQALPTVFRVQYIWDSSTFHLWMPRNDHGAHMECLPP